MSGKLVEMGETDEGELPLPDFPVGGRSPLMLPPSTLDCEKALKTGIRMFSAGSGSPKDDEFCVTHLPSELLGVLGINRDSSSAEKAS
jgi:hypothetical protein